MQIAAGVQGDRGVFAAESRAGIGAEYVLLQMAGVEVQTLAEQLPAVD
jgi:hypothetical protein